MPIVKVVADHFRVPAGEVLGKKRYASLVLCRSVCMYLVRQKFKYSLPEIGKAFDRDHTSVLQALRKIEQRMEVDIWLRSSVAAFMQQIGDIGDNTLILRLSNSSMRLLSAIHEARPQGETIEDTARSLLTLSLNNFGSKKGA